jgi:hypothetical protein
LQGAFVSGSDHFVQFFDADDRLADAVGRFVHVGLAAEEVCVVVATRAHRSAIAAALAARGVDVAAFEARYRYIAVDASTLLCEFYSNGRLNRYRFHDRAGLLLRQAAASGRPVRVFGEMVSLLATDGSIAVALELEELWNELGRSHDFTLFCGYSSESFTGPRAGDALQRVCSLHAHAVGMSQH